VAAKPALPDHTGDAYAAPLICINAALARCWSLAGSHKESAMSDHDHQASKTVLTAAADHFLARLREWWRRSGELASMDRTELQRMAGEFGMSVRDLEELVTRGPQAADLLHERMHALGIARADVEDVARGLMRDLERTCACCDGKDACKQDLEQRPDDPAWKDYCPNATSLESVRRAKGRFA
jgi:hypothetical protein